MGTEADDWPSRRREAFEAHERTRRRAEEAESEQARELVAWFVREARQRGVPAGPLRARTYSGSAGYRTGLTGWYLQPSGSLAIGEDGQFYVLIAPAGFLSRLRGVRIQPSAPALAVGRGARDGESMSFQELLRRRLEAGASFRRLS